MSASSSPLIAMMIHPMRFRRVFSTVTQVTPTPSRNTNAYCHAAGTARVGANGVTKFEIQLSGASKIPLACRTVTKIATTIAIAKVKTSERLIQVGSPRAQDNTIGQPNRSKIYPANRSQKQAGKTYSDRNFCGRDLNQIESRETDGHTNRSWTFFQLGLVRPAVGGPAAQIRSRDRAVYETPPRKCRSDDRGRQPRAYVPPQANDRAQVSVHARVRP